MADPVAVLSADGLSVSLDFGVNVQALPDARRDVVLTLSPVSDPAIVLDLLHVGSGDPVVCRLDRAVGVGQQFRAAYDAASGSLITDIHVGESVDSFDVSVDVSSRGVSVGVFPGAAAGVFRRTVSMATSTAAGVFGSWIELVDPEGGVFRVRGIAHADAESLLGGAVEVEHFDTMYRVRVEDVVDELGEPVEVRPSWRVRDPDRSAGADQEVIAVVPEVSGAVLAVYTARSRRGKRPV